MHVTSTQMMVGGLILMIIAAGAFVTYVYWPTKKTDDQ